MTDAKARKTRFKPVAANAKDRVRAFAPARENDSAALIQGMVQTQRRKDHQASQHVAGLPPDSRRPPPGFAGRGQTATL